MFVIHKANQVLEYFRFSGDLLAFSAGYVLLSSNLEERLAFLALNGVDFIQLYFYFIEHHELEFIDIFLLSGIVEWIWQTRLQLVKSNVCVIVSIVSQIVEDHAQLIDEQIVTHIVGIIYVYDELIELLVEKQRLDERYYVALVLFVDDSFEP